MSRVVHFEIPADDPDRAAKFYTKAFGWQVKKWDGPVEYWMAMTGEGPGINGGILRRPHPGMGTTNTIDVSSVDDALTAIQAAGGSVTQPKMAVPGVGWLAYCNDTEGNMFGIMQNDPNAK